MRFIAGSFHSECLSIIVGELGNQLGVCCAIYQIHSWLERKSGQGYQDPYLLRSPHTFHIIRFFPHPSSLFLFLYLVSRITKVHTQIHRINERTNQRDEDRNMTDERFSREWWILFPMSLYRLYLWPEFSFNARSPREQSLFIITTKLQDPKNPPFINLKKRKLNNSSRDLFIYFYAESRLEHLSWRKNLSEKLTQLFFFIIIEFKKSIKYISNRGLLFRIYYSKELSDLGLFVLPQMACRVVEVVSLTVNFWLSGFRPLCSYFVSDR